MGNQTCPMFLLTLLASKKTVPYVSVPIIISLHDILFWQKLEVFADIMLNTSGIC